MSAAPTMRAEPRPPAEDARSSAAHAARGGDGGGDDPAPSDRISDRISRRISKQQDQASPRARGPEARMAPRPAAGTAARGALGAALALVGPLVLAATAAGCVGLSTAEEDAARDDGARFAARYRPEGQPPPLPGLTAEATLADLLRHAAYRSPEVEGAYHAWAAAIEEITVARSLPDPRVGFEADIARMVEGLLPSLMVDIPGPGKLGAAASVAAAEAAGQRAALEAAVLAVGLAVKQAYYRLGFIERTARVQRDTIALLDDLGEIARKQTAAGRATLQDVLRIEIERERLATALENLEDSRSAVLAELKAALGLGAADPDPPLPARFEAAGAPPSPEGVLAAALARNPRIRAVEAEVRRAEAGVVVAERARIPDVTLGIEADVKASPVLWRPSASVSLPIWRDKNAARIAAAEHALRGAAARRTSAELRLAAEVAATLFAYREARRNEDLLLLRLLPKARQSLEVARAGYVGGRSSFLDVIDAQRTLLDFELSAIAATTQRELALAALSLAILAEPPPGGPTDEGAVAAAGAGAPAPAEGAGAAGSGAAPGTGAATEAGPPRPPSGADTEGRSEGGR